MLESIDTPESEPLTTSSVLNGVRLSTRIMPAVRGAQGGDWCEAFVVSEDVIALSIGDVCGHGSEKFDAMVAIREAIRDAVAYGMNPAQALAEANRFLRLYDPEEYATAILGFLNTRQRSLVFANAGHPAPLMTSAIGSVFLAFPATDPPLGIMNRMVPALHRISVPAATLLVFYTDGVSEHERNPLQGEAELRDAATFAYEFSNLASAATIEKQMFLTGSNMDDAAILTARTPLSPIVRAIHPKRSHVVRTAEGLVHVRDWV